MSLTERNALHYTQPGVQNVYTTHIIVAVANDTCAFGSMCRCRAIYTCCEIVPDALPDMHMETD